MRSTSPAWLLVCVLAGCSSPSQKRAGAEVMAVVDAAPPHTRQPFRRCGALPFTPLPTVSFEHKRSGLVVRMGSPRHVAADALAPSDLKPVVGAKFAYGSLSKDLEDERVVAFLDDCTALRTVGEARTDDDGRVRITIGAPLGPGAYALYFQVMGDGSGARATLWVLPRGTHIVVSDIDGTLTTSDGELFRDVKADVDPYSRDYVQKAYPGGVDLMKAHVERGHIVLYITGRPYLFADMTRGWLHDLGFPIGPVVLTSSTSESLPTQGGVGDFKLRNLRALLAAGMTLDWVYGNADTDVWAYAQAEIPPERTFIIGKHAGEGGTRAAKDSWQTRADEVRTLPAVVQPYD